MMSEPLTDAQQNYIIKLLPKIGKKRYQQAKTEAGIDLATTIPQLTKGETGRLIGKMILAKNRGGQR